MSQGSSRAAESSERSRASHVASPRVARAYLVVFALNLLMIVMVFAGPTWRRVMGDTWQRGAWVYKTTASLDLHALLGYGVLVLVFAQVFAGFSMLGRRRRGVHLHRALGRAFIRVALPLFVVVGVWVIVDRAFLLEDGASTLFRRHRLFVILEMAQVLALMSYFATRAMRAIRRGDVLGHVDGILAMFLSAGLLATIRFVYAVIWLFRGNPLSIAGTYLIAVALTVAELAVAYGCAGRLRRNRITLAVIVVSTALMALLGAPLYSIWDAP